MKGSVEYRVDRGSVNGLELTALHIPADWTLTMEDALPNGSGSPGLFGNSLVTPFQSFVYYDNIQVSDNKQGHANAQ